MTKRSIRRPLSLLGLAVLLDLFLVAAYLCWVQANISSHATQPNYDVGIVFYGDVGNNGGLGEESRRRADAAARRYADGSVARLIAVGGRRHHPDHFGSEQVGERLQRLGVPADAISVDRTSFDTFSNWRQAVAMMQEQHLQRPLLISSALHLARIQHIAAQPFAIALAPSQPLREAIQQRPLQIWLDVHNEWIAWAALILLPTRIYRDWVRRWRDYWR